MNSWNVAPVTRVLADDRTRRELGASGLRLVTSHIWLGDCQSCGRALAPAEVPSLVAADYRGYVEFSLHHLSCRTPAWCERFIVDFRATNSYSYKTVVAMLPHFPDAPRMVLLVNPSVERVRLTRDADGPPGRWRTLRPIVEGFRPIEQLAARASGGELYGPKATALIDDSPQASVEVTVKDTASWVCSLNEHGVEIVRSTGGVVVLVSNLVSPSVLVELDAIDRFLRGALAGDLVDAAWVPLDGSPDTRNT